jgi:hypothetical protein
MKTKIHAVTWIELLDAPAAPPIALSQYAPEPTIGESPTRPGTLCEAPLVDVPHEMLPFA